MHTVRPLLYRPIRRKSSARSPAVSAGETPLAPLETGGRGVGSAGGAIEIDEAIPKVIRGKEQRRSAKPRTRVVVQFRRAGAVKPPSIPGNSEG